MARVSAMWWIAMFLMHSCVAFYLPGVAPQDYGEGDDVELKVNKLTSVHTQLPYAFYSLPFCAPSVVEEAAENLGEVLSGDTIENSIYSIKMQKTEQCNVLCQKKYTAEQLLMFSERIEEEYRVNWIVDNLPAATIYFIQTSQGLDEHYEKGFPLGFVGTAEHSQKDIVVGEPYVNNHVVIKLLIHGSDPGSSGYRIVGFEVTPSSIQHEVGDDGKLKTCPPTNVAAQSVAPLKDDTREIVWTYDVEFESSHIRWASRWDMYLKMMDEQIHWFSIINSLMIVLFLSGMVAMILMRTLHRDIAGYNAIVDLDDPEAQAEETGWKLVHGDVFRPPKNGGMLSVLIGTGVQVNSMTVLTLFFALLGLLSPANRGGLMTTLLLLFVFMGSFAGFFSARFYKMFGLSDWRRNTLLTATFFPGFNFLVFFVLNLFLWGEKSSGAVPFGTMFALLVLWFGISVPLVYLGAYFGFRKEEITPPVKVNLIPRQIPDQPWYMQSYFSVLVGGVLPFGACFIEVFFIMSSVWLNRFYYMFGFLFLVFLILFVTCAEITIVMAYFQLCSEDYDWWWRSFFTAGSSAIYLFLYSILYFFTKLDIIGFIPGLLFFGYMGLVSFAFFVLTGTIGFCATFLFVRAIYSSLKID